MKNVPKMMKNMFEDYQFVDMTVKPVFSVSVGGCKMYIQSSRVAPKQLISALDTGNSAR